MAEPVGRVLQEPELGFEPSTDAWIYPTRVYPAPTEPGELKGFRHPGGSVAAAVGARFGDTHYWVNVADYDDEVNPKTGKRSHHTRASKKLLTVEGFGAPRNVAPRDVPVYAAEPQRIESAPSAPREASMSPPMVQTPQEALLSSVQGAAAAQSGDRMLLQMLAPLLTQAINAQGPEFQRRVLEVLTRIEERQVRQDERLTRLEAQQADETARSTRKEELLVRLAKELEGTPITSVEQGKALIQRLGPEVCGLVAGEPEERASRWMELLGPLLAQLGPAVAPMLAALFAKIAAAVSAGMSVPAAIAVATEEPAEPEPEPEPAMPPPAPPRRAPAPARATFRPPAPAAYRPPGVTTSHAGPGPADTGT